MSAIPIVPSLALQAVAAFVVAGVWITGATLLAERAGSRVGGLVANLPSNVLVAMFFLAWTQGPGFAAEAAHSLPLGMAIDTGFLLAVVLLLPRGLGVAMAGGFGAWLALAVAAQALPPLGLAAGLVLYVVVALSSFAYLERGGRIRAVAGLPAVRPTMRQLAVRAGLAGAAVAGVVLVAGLAGPYLTGILAVFPVVLAVTMVFLTRARGQAFAQAAGKVLTLSSSNLVVFGLGVMVAFPRWGPWTGSLVAYALAAAWVVLLRPVLGRAS